MWKRVSMCNCGLAMGVHVGVCVCVCRYIQVNQETTHRSTTGQGKRRGSAIQRWRRWKQKERSRGTSQWEVRHRERVSNKPGSWKGQAGQRRPMKWVGYNTEIQREAERRETEVWMAGKADIDCVFFLFLFVKGFHCGGLYEVHTVSSQTFFVWALLLIVHTWNSSPFPSNFFRLQCTCCTIQKTSGRPHGSPLVWACQWPSSQPLSSPQLSHNDSLWA